MTTTPTRGRGWRHRGVKIVLALAAAAVVVIIGLPPAVEGAIVSALTVMALSRPPVTAAPARRGSWRRRVFNIVLALALLAGVAMIVIPHDRLPPAFQGGVIGGLAMIAIRQLWRGGDRRARP
jgi:hypothetical protein